MPLLQVKAVSAVRTFLHGAMVLALAASPAAVTAGCSDDASPPTSGDAGGAEDASSGSDAGGEPAKDGGSATKSCPSGSSGKCDATERCFPASCAGQQCGGKTVTVPAEERCIDGCCETLEASCDRVCPG